MNTSTPRKRGRSRVEAAQFITDNYFPIVPGTLSNKATAGDGPAFRVVLGRVEYDDIDLVTWAESQISRPIRSRHELKQLEARA